MGSKENHANRRHDDRGSHLPPKTLSGKQEKRRKKKPRLAWYQHLTVLIPLIACVVFAVLIGGLLGVRQVIVLVHGPAEQSESRPNAPVVSKAVAEGTTPESSEGVSDDLAPKDPEVLPAAAARLPGRKLARMLLVGTGQDMFPTISGAVKFAVPGDVIEVRSNGPLLEQGAEHKLDERTAGDRPLTIRAGEGFQPVVRFGHYPGWDLKNIDVAISGLHITADSQITDAGKNLIISENGNVHIADCTFTGAPIEVNQGVYPLIIRNSSDNASFQAEFVRCFLRNTKLASVEGPRLSFVMQDSGAVFGGTSFLGCMLDEAQSIEIQRCTWLHCYGPGINGGPGKAPPVQGLKLHYEQVIGGLVACCPVPASLAVGSEFGLVQSNEDALRLFQLAIPDFRSTHSFWRYWGGPGAVVNDKGFGVQRDNGIVEFPTTDDTLTFGEQVQLAWSMIHQQGDTPGAWRLLRTALPEQLNFTSTGPLAELFNQGIVCGCDVTKLPVPPPMTLEPFEVPMK